MGSLGTSIKDFYQKKSLRFRLIILILSVTVFVLVGAAAIIDKKAISIIQKNRNQVFVAANHTLATTVSVWLESHLNFLKTLVSLPDIISMDPEKQRPILLKMAAAYPYMYLICTTDRSGINVARNDDAAPKDYSDRDWVKGPLSGAPVTFQSLIGRTSGRPALTVSMPIKNDSGKIVGVGMFTTDLEHLASQVRATSIGKTGFAYLVDGKNRVIAHPDPEFSNELRDLTDYPPIRDLRNGIRGEVHFIDKTGQHWRAYISTLANGWGVIVQEHEEELLSASRLFRKVAFIVIFGAVVFLAVITWWIVHRALKPIEMLTDAVKNVSFDGMGQSDFQVIHDVSLHSRHHDEVGTLAESFSRMTNRLQITLARLERELLERKETEKALRESEEKYRTLVNNVNIGIYRNTSGPYGRFIQANPAMIHMFGYDSLDEFLTIRVADLYQNPEERKSYVEEVLEKGCVKDKELAMRKKDGTPIWCSITATPQFDNDGRILFMDGVAKDITELKQAEEEKAVLESQLLQSQKLEAIGQLAGGVSHDFNNMLTALIGYGNLMLVNIDNKELLSTYIDQILAVSDKAAKLTKSLLAFSRKQVMEAHPHDVNSIVKEMEKLMHRLLREDIELRTVLADNRMTILADITQIDQILLNLAANARDAMLEGGCFTIETRETEFDEDFVRTHGYAAPGKYAQISVSDTGCGMDKKTREKIFEPFFTTKAEGKGTGLGLSIVYGIVKQHNGFINCYSEPGVGTTFHIYFPLIEAEVEEKTEQQTEIQGGNETILVAEDNTDTRLLIKEILESRGYSVIEAENGEEALQLYEKSKDTIKLLLFDVIMPKKNGVDTYREINKQSPGMKTLFMSGYTGDIVLDQGGMEDAFDFIAKPLSPNVLLRMTREILDRPIQIDSGTGQDHGR